MGYVPLYTLNPRNKTIDQYKSRLGRRKWPKGTTRAPSRLEDSSNSNSSSGIT